MKILSTVKMIEVGLKIKQLKEKQQSLIRSINTAERSSNMSDAKEFGEELYLVEEQALMLAKIQQLVIQREKNKNLPSRELDDLINTYQSTYKETIQYD